MNVPLVIPDDYPFIWEAVEASTPGDSIIVRSGIYKEDYIFFPMVKEIFPENVLRGLVELYILEDQKKGGKTLENNRKLIEQMSTLL